MILRCFTLWLWLACLPFVAEAKDLYEIRSLSNRELLRLYDQILVDACHHSDQFWHEWQMDARGGFWGSGRSDQMNEGIRAISEMVFTCAVVVRYSETATLAERAEYARKAIPGIRYATASHLSGPQKCTDGKPWGESWQSAMWAGTLGFGSWLLWDRLDPELRRDVERVLASEADRFLAGQPPGGSFNDTKAEENGWNLICISLAVNMFPNHSHAKEWQEKAIAYMINTLSVPQDRQDRTIVDGRPVSEWFSGENLHPDFTLENHGFFHPSYVACSSYFLTQAAMHYTYAHRSIPEAATHHLLDTWRMFQGIILPCGESAYPQGMDWELHALPYLNLYASLASYQKDPLAARLENTFVQYMRAWQQMQHGDLTVPGSPLGFTRHAICAEQAAYGLLAHKLFGPPVIPISTRKAAALVDGVRHYDYTQFITHRTAQKFVSFSWTNRMMGMIIPIGPGHENNPAFTVPVRDGFVGSFQLDPKGDTKTTPLQHEWKQTANGVETTGTLLLNGGRLKQTLRVSSIGSQMVIYEDRVKAMTNVTVTQELGVPLGIENDKITGGERHLWNQDGQMTFDWQKPCGAFPVSGSWANVDGRLGVIAVTGSGMSYAQAREYTRGMAVYADMLYGSFSAQRRQFRGGEEVARRIMIFGAEFSPKSTAALARSVKLSNENGAQILRFKLPEGGEAHLRL